MVVGLSLMGLTYGPLGTVLSELFPTAVRYTGSSLTFNLAGIFGASLAPYIATWLASNYGLQYVGYYLTVAAALTLVGLVSIHETRDSSLDWASFNGLFTKLLQIPGIRPCPPQRKTSEALPRWGSIFCPRSARAMGRLRYPIKPIGLPGQWTRLSGADVHERQVPGYRFARGAHMGACRERAIGADRRRRRPPRQKPTAAPQPAAAAPAQVRPAATAAHPAITADAQRAFFKTWCVGCHNQAAAKARDRFLAEAADRRARPSERRLIIEIDGRHAARRRA